MRQLEEQIRVLVEESVMRKRRRLDPQAVPFPAPPGKSGCTVGKTEFCFRNDVFCFIGGRGHSGSTANSGPPKRVRKTQSNVSRTKKPKEAQPPPVPVPPVAAAAPPQPLVPGALPVSQNSD